MSVVGPGDGFDRESALARVGGDLELLKDIARVFLDDYPRALGELRDAGTRSDCESVERAAHGLKGAAANFGARDVVAASLHLEQIGRAGRLDEFASALDALQSAMATLRAELQDLIAS